MDQRNFDSITIISYNKDNIDELKIELYFYMLYIFNFSESLLSLNMKFE